MSDLKRTVFRLLEPGDSDDHASRVVDGFIISLILVNGVISVLETVPSLQGLNGTFFWAVEIASVIIFTVEYMLRIWSCTVKIITEAISKPSGKLVLPPDFFRPCNAVGKALRERWAGLHKLGNSYAAWIIRRVVQ